MNNLQKMVIEFDGIRVEVFNEFVYNKIKKLITRTKKNKHFDVPSLYKRWTEEENEKMIGLLKEGHTPKEVAKVLGRTEKSIILRNYRLSIPLEKETIVI